MHGVPVKNEKEALFIASEMEKRAIKLYERAAMVFKNSAVAAAVSDMLRDEREHLCRFQSLLGEEVPTGADALMLSAYAAGVLFEGGLHGAVKSGAFDSPKALLAYAAEQEQIAVNCYTRFAESCTAVPAAQAAFLTIAGEEALHLAALEKAQTA